jgi:uncharacterized protein (DUF885 family)
MKNAVALVIGIGALAAVVACGAGTPPMQAAQDSDSTFTAAANQFVDGWLRRHPTQATYLGIHDYDSQLDDYTRAGVDAEVAWLNTERPRIAAIGPDGLSLQAQLDREQLLTAIDGRLLELQVVRPWATNPDTYSSGLAQTAFVMIKRSFATPEARLRALAARERAMPAALQAARTNLDHPPAVFTDIAIEQLGGNRAFFAAAVPAAFASVKDPALQQELKTANQGVLDALDAYKQFLHTILKPQSTGRFALGGDVLRRKYAADEMVDLPIERLLQVAQADLARNQARFRETAAKIAPARAPEQVMASLAADHPAPDQLLTTTQDMLDSLRRFIEDKGLVTIPSKVPARVEETPPFMRAVTSASMDTPGPFETQATEAFYNMTLPDPSWPAPRREQFMRQWYVPAISNVSVHEVYPGHYLQFLYAPQFPTRVRKVFGANTNIEGWAHYCETMMLDEGFHDGDPRYRLAQLQDALLRDVRFIVGIKLHSQGMSIQDAQKMFEREAYEPAPVALAEARRGTSDPTYGYYTLGKLMILKLRDDVQARRRDSFTLRGFHDEFLKMGPLPLPLIRRAMLGETGELLPAGS